LGLIEACPFSTRRRAHGPFQAYWTSEEAQEVKELEKLEERCLKRWKKLIIGLRIRQRLQREYGPSAAQVLDSEKPVEVASQVFGAHVLFGKYVFFAY
jgi:hypothetical protein